MAVLLSVNIFMTSALAALFTWPIAAFVGTYLKIIDYPDGRKIHESPTIRTGGILIYLGFILGVIVSRSYLQPRLPAIYFASVVFFLGLMEDIFHLNAKLRLLLQGAIAYFFITTTNVVLTDLGLFVLPDFLQVPFTVFAIIGITNAFNMIDGMNGLSSGMGIIATLSLGILAYAYNDVNVFTVSIVYAGALAGFMALNLRGKVFMGDSGSYLTGFIIAILSIKLAMGNPEISPFAPLIFVFIPVFDALFAIYRRKRQHKNPFKADKRHLHHILSRRYRSNKAAVGVLLSMQASLSFLGILFYRYTHVLVLLAFLMTLAFIILWFRRVRLGPVSF